MQLTFVPLVSGFALRARLISILPLVLIAWPANRKRADIASNEWFSSSSLPNIISTDLADLTPQVLHGLCLSIYSLKLISVYELQC